MSEITTENTVTTSTVEVATSAEVDRLELVTIVTDGGVGGRGRVTIVYMDPADALKTHETAMAVRRL